MAISWASRRKLIYAYIVMGFILSIITFLFFFFFYKAPTCFDNTMNGDETGIDCGGSCRKLCQSAFLPPRIEWGGAKIEKIVNGLYNASSYIVNPNINGAAIDAPYKITLYDAEGIYITERSGVVTLYPHRNSIAFQTAINTEKRIPAKATFEFTSTPVWFKSADQLSGISVINKNYKEDENGSSLEVTLQNNSLTPYHNLQVSVVLSDEYGNVIGFSQTKLDSIEPKQKQIAPFTWPVNRNGKVASIEVIPIIEPIQAN